MCLIINLGRWHNVWWWWLELAPLQRRTMRIISTPEYANSEAGVSVDYVFDKFPNKDANAIRDALSHLFNEGQLSSTVDENHYKCIWLERQRNENFLLCFY